MVSPERLRRYPFFGPFGSDQLNAMAMLTDEIDVETGDIVFHAGQPANALYFLMEGSVDLHYVAVDEINTELRKDFFVSEINPGEPFGISALLEPYQYTGTVRVAQPSRVLRLDAAGLRALCEVDPKIAAILMRQVAKAAMSRLHDTRIQLAAARV
jgi:CRP-like cAMP-binding protein